MNTYIAKNTIDDYLADNELNARIYEVLLNFQDSETHCRNKLKKSPFEIFNQVYDICDELRQYLYTGKIDPSNKDTQTLLAEFFLVNVDDQILQSPNIGDWQPIFCSLPKFYLSFKSKPMCAYVKSRWAKR